MAEAPAEQQALQQEQPEQTILPSPPSMRLHATTSALPPTHSTCPTTYFMRRAPGTPLPKSAAAREMEAALSWGLLPAGPSFASLHQLLTGVLLPWLAAHGSNGGASAADAAGTATAGLAAAASRLCRQVESGSKHLGAEVALPLPAGVDLHSALPEALASDEAAVLACEQCVVEWARVVGATLAREAAAQPQGRGPLAELQHWQRRAAVYGSLQEQLGLPAAASAVEVVARSSSDPGLLASFRAQASELARAALEAADNVKFLLTLERHFRAIEIWVVSRHYGDDMRMSGLLERVAWGLQARLRAALADVRALLHAPASEACALVSTCADVARGWQASYLAMRERIEASGHHARWEFSRALLFEATNYAGEVCTELLAMLTTVDDFRRFLGPELKDVTGDGGMVDEVLVVLQACVEPVERVGFDVLDKAHAAEWRAIRGRFARDADDIRLATRDLLDACFRRLRSVEAAAALLASFRGLRGQGAVAAQMADKLTDVLEAFLREIEATAKAFADGREAPPVPRCLPPVAGAIAWARSLFARLRCTMGQLRALEPGLEALDPGRRAVQAYTKLARAMLAYEKQAFAAWCAGEAAAAGPALQQPLLVRCAAAANSSIGGSNSGSGEAAVPVSASAVPSGALESPFVVNLSHVLLRLIREARHLDRLSFAVPELAVNVALQEGRLRAQAEALASLLEHQRAAVGALSTAERVLLGDQLARLDAALEPALGRLNWASLAVPQFVAGATKARAGAGEAGAIEQFQALSGQVKRHAAQIERAVAAIARATLLPMLATDCGVGAGGAFAPAAAQQQERQVPGLQEFYDRCEQARQSVVEGLVAHYRSISALLLKVEEAVAGSASGRAPKLAPYVAYWERRVFAAISSAVLRAMDALGTCLRGGRPLLRVQLTLLASEVVVSPSMAEVSKQLSRLMRNVVDSAKAFVRWMDGTCLEAPPQFPYGEDSEPFLFTFFSDVSTSPAVIRSMLAANHAVQRVTAAVGRHADGWKQYAPVWCADRQGLLARLAARRLPPAILEAKASLYRRLGEEVAAAGSEVDIGFLRLASALLAGAICAEAQLWADALGSLDLAQVDGPAQATLAECVSALPAALCKAGGGATGANESVHEAAATALGGAAEVDLGSAS